MITDNIAPTRAEQLRELVRFGYSEKAIAGWSEARIITTLSSRRAEEKTALARATSKAQQIDGARGTASRLERQMAAEYLQQTLDRDRANLTLTFLYVGYCLSDEEGRMLAEQLISLFRGEPAC